MIKIFNTLVLFLVSLNIYSIEVLEVEILDSYQLKKEFPGKLLPVEQSKLAFEIPGKIKYIYVNVGDKVEKGQILAKLDDREANARLNQAKASYELSVQVFDRFEDLRQQGHISIQDLDKARSDLTIAKSQYEFYKVKLEQTNLMSPYSGIIQSRFLDSGTVISQGIPILEIIDSNYVEAHISVPVLYLNEKLTIKYGGHLNQLSNKFWGMDRFRIIALENILNYKLLKKENKNKVKKVLKEKIKIYLKGLKKREKKKKLFIMKIK